MAERFIVIDGQYIIDTEIGESILRLEVMHRGALGKFVCALLNEHGEAYDEARGATFRQGARQA